MTLGGDRPIAELILASASPRRRDLLKLLGLPYAVSASDLVETLPPGATPQATVTSLARAKARAVAATRSDYVVIAADTVVAMDGHLFGKPRDTDEAVAMLRALRGRWHRVWTGLAVLAAAEGSPAGRRMPRADKERQLVLAVKSDVLMRHYSDADIGAYVATGDPLDKAAAYAIQRNEFSPVAQLAGCYANVMGMPLCHLYLLLQRMGMKLPLDPLETCPPYLGITCPGLSGRHR